VGNILRRVGRLTMIARRRGVYLHQAYFRSQPLFPGSFSRIKNDYVLREGDTVVSFSLSYVFATRANLSMNGSDEGRMDWSHKSTRVPPKPASEKGVRRKWKEGVTKDSRSRPSSCPSEARENCC